MLKSKTIAENKRFYDEFINTIKFLSVEDIERIGANAKEDILICFHTSRKKVLNWKISSLKSKKISRKKIFF